MISSPQESQLGNVSGYWGKSGWTGCVPLFWPRVLKGRIYPYLVRGMHDLYLLALMVLFSAGLSCSIFA